uniref:Integrase catalytic domain-containing protein n=1 Tax=Heterorhabditis bacteriophora TaxID=37862 RepID=A0A1I7XK80_HETBA
MQSDTRLQQLAELEIIRWIQNDQPPPPKDKSDLQLYRDKDGLWRSGGRLQNSVLPEDDRHSIYIPHNSEATYLLILKYHTEYQYCRPTFTLAQTRQKYWIPRARSVVKRILHKKCMECRRRVAKPFALPAIRKSRSTKRADYCGLLTVTKEGEEIYYKIWIDLFTCLVTRDIHLEIVTELSSETFINAFRRFVARRGCPSLLLTDNETNFRLAAELITSLWTEQQDNSVYRFCRSKQIEWKFIPSLAPWFGGAYERMIEILEHRLSQHTTGKTTPETSVEKGKSKKNTSIWKSDYRRQTPTKKTMETRTLMAVTLITTIRANKCEKKNTVFIDSCSKSGVIIYKNNKDNYSWSYQSCGNQEQLRNVTDEKTSKEICGPRCRCPSWANGCSYGHREQRTNSTIERLFHQMKPDVCSFKRTVECQNPVRRKIHKVRLVDGKDYFVKSLGLIHKQYEEQICFGKGEITGTNDYCARYPCISNGTQICIFSKTEATYVQSGEVLLPITAWATTKLEVFNHQMGKYNGTHTCSIRMKCHDEGIHAMGRNVLSLATDLNSHALECTRETSRLNGIEINVIQTDLEKGLDQLQKKVDLLLFNPPYVPTENDPENGLVSRAVNSLIEKCHFITLILGAMLGGWYFWSWYPGPSSSSRVISIVTYRSVLPSNASFQ